MSGVEFFVDAAGEHRFRIEGNNHEIVAQSEGYRELRKAEHGAEVVATQAIRWLVRKHGARAVVEMVHAAEAEAVDADTEAEMADVEMDETADAEGPQ